MWSTAYAVAAFNQADQRRPGKTSASRIIASKQAYLDVQENLRRDVQPPGAQLGPVQHRDLLPALANCLAPGHVECLYPCLGKEPGRGGHDDANSASIRPVQRLVIEAAVGV